MFVRAEIVPRRKLRLPGTGALLGLGQTALQKKIWKFFLARFARGRRTVPLFEIGGRVSAI
jgi:hypothetical protein